MSITEIAMKYWESLKEGHTSTDTPTAIFMMGLPGSGKSSSLGVILEEISKNKEDFIEIDPDECMKQIDGYNNSKASDFNRNGVIICSHILTNCIKEKYNFIYSGTGKSYKQYMTMINKANKNGFDTILVYVKVYLKTAKNRNKLRTRQVPNEVIQEIYEKLKETHSRKKGTVMQTNFEILSEKVNTYYIIDNNKEKPIIKSTIINE